MENKTEIKEKILNKEVVIFAVFLFFSFGLWYLNYLGKQTQAEFNTPLKFINLPTGQTITQDTPKHLTVSLKGTGYSIIKLKYYGKKDSVLVDISSIAYKSHRNIKYDYYVPTSLFVKPAMLLRSGCEVTDIKPDTLYIALEKIESEIIKTAEE